MFTAGKIERHRKMSKAAKTAHARQLKRQQELAKQQKQGGRRKTASDDIPDAGVAKVMDKKEYDSDGVAKAQGYESDATTESEYSVQEDDECKLPAKKNPPKKKNPPRAAVEQDDDDSTVLPFDEREEIEEVYAKARKLPATDPQWKKLWEMIPKNSNKEYSQNPDSMKKFVKRYFKAQENKGLQKFVASGEFQTDLYTVATLGGIDAGVNFIMDKQNPRIVVRLFFPLEGNGARVVNYSKPANHHVFANGRGYSLTLGNNAKLFFDDLGDLTRDIIACGEPWLRVAKSKINGAGWGLFALRDFPKDTLIGIYGAEKGLFKDKNSGKDLTYAIETKEGVGYNPMVGEMYMGLHFANTASDGFTNNAYVSNELLMWAKTNIKTGDEILWDYNRVQPKTSPLGEVVVQANVVPTKNVVATGLAEAEDDEDEPPPPADEAEDDEDEPPSAPSMPIKAPGVVIRTSPGVVVRTSPRLQEAKNKKRREKMTLPDGCKRPRTTRLPQP